LRLSDRDNLNDRVNKRQNGADKVYKFHTLTVVVRRVSVTATQVLQKANALHSSTTKATASEAIIHGIPTVSCGKVVGYNAGLKYIHHPLQHKKIKLGQENS
jgi:hypothetical protein